MNNSSKNYYFYTTKQVERNGKVSNRRVTVAGIYNGEDLRIGVAECSDKDTFTRKKGRLIAEGRAAKKPSTVVAVSGKIGEAFLTIAKSL